MYFPSKPFIFYNPLSLSLSPPCPSRSCCRLSCRSVPFHGAPRRPFGVLRSMVRPVLFLGVLRSVPWCDPLCSAAYKPPRPALCASAVRFAAPVAWPSRSAVVLPLCRGSPALPWFSRSAVALPLCRCFPALPLLSRSSFPFAVFCTPLLSRGLIVSPSPFRPRRSACHNLRAASSQAVPSPRWESARRFARDS